MVAIASPAQVKLAAPAVETLPTNWPWPLLKVPLDSNRVATPDPEELLDEELELELLDEELLDELELDDELLEELLEEFELDEELEELLDELLDELDDELLDEELLLVVPPQAASVIVIRLAPINCAILVCNRDPKLLLILLSYRRKL